MRACALGAFVAWLFEVRMRQMVAMVGGVAFLQLVSRTRKKRFLLLLLLNIVTATMHTIAMKSKI